MFDESALLCQLNDEQRRAATHGPEPLLVLAGAGTGKTATLAARVGWLQTQGVAADRILLLTFTRRAADDMLGRLGEPGRWAEAGAGAAGRPAAGGVWGGPFPAIAHPIIPAPPGALSPPPPLRPPHPPPTPPPPAP